MKADLLQALGHVNYVKSRRRVERFLGGAPSDVEPRAASWEVAKACLVPIDEAREKLYADQGAFLDMLVARLDE